MDIKKDELIKLIEDNLSYEAIGKLFNCGREKIRRIAIKYGINRKHIFSHPNLIVNYFENINTKEKAYWLGFLYADGYIQKNNCTLVLDLSEKDINQIHKFCQTIGGNPEKIKIRVHHNFKNVVKSVSVRISNKKFVENLIKWGCVNKKSKIIRWPHVCLNNIELRLSFLAGYYDGDGMASSNTICSGAYNFLEDIKSVFNISNCIELKGRVYLLKMGADLKIEMVKMYPYGMKRKQGRHNILKNNYERINSRKFNPSKEELNELIIKKMSLASIGRMFGVSDNSIRKRALKLGITLNKKKE